MVSALVHRPPGLSARASAESSRTRWRGRSGNDGMSPAGVRRHRPYCTARPSARTATSGKMLTGTEPPRASGTEVTSGVTPDTVTRRGARGVGRADRRQHGLRVIGPGDCDRGEEGVGLTTGGRELEDVPQPRRRCEGAQVHRVIRGPWTQRRSQLVGQVRDVQFVRPGGIGRAYSDPTAVADHREPRARRERLAVQQARELLDGFHTQDAGSGEQRVNGSVR